MTVPVSSDWLKFNISFIIEIYTLWYDVHYRYLKYSSVVIVWDQRCKPQVQSVYHDYQITSVCMSSDGESLFSGGIDNVVRYVNK